MSSINLNSSNPYALQQLFNFMLNTSTARPVVQRVKHVKNRSRRRELGRRIMKWHVKTTFKSFVDRLMTISVILID